MNIRDCETVQGLDIFQLASIILSYEKGEPSPSENHSLNNALLGMSEIWTQRHLSQVKD